MSSSIGMMKFPRYGKIKLMFQTTNQLYLYHSQSWVVFTWHCDHCGFHHRKAGGKWSIPEPRLRWENLERRWGLVEALGAQGNPRDFHQWPVGGLNPSEKYESQLGGLATQYMGKSKMFQTTNQLLLINQWEWGGHLWLTLCHVFGLVHINQYCMTYIGHHSATAKLSLTHHCFQSHDHPQPPSMHLTMHNDARAHHSCLCSPSVSSVRIDEPLNSGSFSIWVAQGVDVVQFHFIFALAIRSQLLLQAEGCFTPCCVHVGQTFLGNPKWSGVRVGQLW